MVNLIVFPSGNRYPSKFLNVPVREHYTFYCEIFECGKIMPCLGFCKSGIGWRKLLEEAL
jgi:hypothetical protein